jgi:hypothetical protein
MRNLPSGVSKPPDGVAPEIEKSLPVQADLACPERAREIFRFSSDANQLPISAVPFRKRGVGHRHERWDGMRWTLQRRHVLDARGRTARLANGEVVWFGRPDAGVKSAMMSGVFPGIAPATVTTEPGRRGEHEGNR